MVQAIKSRHVVLGVVVAIIVHIADRFTKWWVVHQVDVHTFPQRVFEGFNIVLFWNRGVSFGMFENHDARMLLTALTMTLVLALCVWLWRETVRLNAYALGLMIGGATGNIVDRVYYGAVADFLDVYWQHYHWPAFNIADSAICAGVMLLILQTIWDSKKIKQMDVE